MCAALPACLCPRLAVRHDAPLVEPLALMLFAFALLPIVVLP